MTALYLPDIRYALSEFNQGLHPNGEEVAASLRTWVGRYLKRATGDPSKADAFCLAAAMSYPDTDGNRLRICAEWITVLFVWDDLFDVPIDSDLVVDEQGAREVNRVMSWILTQPETFAPMVTQPVTGAFHSFWSQFRATSSPNIQKRFVEAVLKYAEGAAKQVASREKRGFPNIKEFIANRQSVSGVETLLALVEYCLQIQVPDCAYYHPTLQQLRNSINEVISWTNDIYSFNKEQACGDHANLVAVVAIEKGIPVQSAITYVSVMVQEAIDRYHEGLKKTPKFDPVIDALVSKYVSGIECVCTGLVSWHFQIDRYFGENFREVSDKLVVDLLPKEKNALVSAHQLQYDKVLISTPQS